MGQNRAANRASDSKSTQRERLLAGMLAAIKADGYDATTIRQVITRAGVSRPTFYEYFTDKDACFLALYRDISERLLDRVARAVNASPPERALQSVVRKLLEHAETEPAQAQFLANDGLAGGPPALDERERTIRALNKTVKTAHATASPRTRSPDIPTPAVIGATQWLIAQEIRRGERNLARLSQQLTQWLTRYEHPIGKHRWSTLDPGPWPQTSPQPRAPADEPLPLVLSQGSRALTRTLGHNQRRRILVATAESAVQGGYTATTVTAITARAGLNKHVFYDHFRDKRQAFLVLHELAFQQSMDVGANAYFSEKEWPERVWRCLIATSYFHAAHPPIAHVGLVETHALGPFAIQRLEDSGQAFATLLRADGRNTRALPNVRAAEAIAAAIFEIAHDRVRHQRAEDLPRYAYLATYLALAPFLGVRAANRFVERKVKDAEGKPGSSTVRRRS